jgi:hypothetical protein
MDWKAAERTGQRKFGRPTVQERPHSDKRPAAALPGDVLEVGRDGRVGGRVEELAVRADGRFAHLCTWLRLHFS